MYYFLLLYSCAGTFGFAGGQFLFFLDPLFVDAIAVHADDKIHHIC